MTFYIPEFVCGVLATIVIEFILIISYAVYRKNKGDTDE